jgi:hypothetical protein
MKTDSCQRYLEDPEANAGHLETCEECRALFADPDVPFRHEPIDIADLPLAPWEGAAHRPWPLIAGTVLAVLAAAVALFTVSGVSPLHGFTHAVQSGIPSLEVLELLASGVQHAPPAFRLLAILAFVVVNSLLYLLLRKAPKGLDV